MSGVVGSQVPRHRVAAAYSVSAGGDAGELGREYGLTPDPWQQQVLDDWLAVGSNGRLASGVCGVFVPRQNGKNAILEIVELFKATIQGRRILHTAHELKSARKAFMRLRSFFENERQFPDLYRMVKSIRATNGQEAIVLHHPDCATFERKCGCPGWGSVEFVARSRGSARGFTVDDLVCDEAQELSDEQLEALLPTVSAAPSGDPQQIFLGTPPGPLADGSVVLRLRGQALSGGKRIAWTEFSIPDESDPDDLSRQWRKLAGNTNPALGRRLNFGTVSDEHESMSAAGFARERLGWWDRGQSATSVIPADKWAQSAVDEASLVGGKVFGVSFSRSGNRVALAGAGKTDAGVHVEVIDGLSGTIVDGVGRLADWLAVRWGDTDRIMVAGSGAVLLQKALTDRGVPGRGVVVADTGTYVEACQAFLEGVRSGVVSHPRADSRRDMLDIAVRSAVQKKKGSAWGWGSSFKDGSEVPLEAVSLAYLGAKMAKAKRRERSGRKRVSVV